MGQPRPLFVYFWSFQTNIITIFTTNKCEKCPSSIQCRDSNPRPPEREPLPITTRPGLPPSWKNFTTRSRQGKFHPSRESYIFKQQHTFYWDSSMHMGLANGMQWSILYLKCSRIVDYDAIIVMTRNLHRVRLQSCKLQS